MGTAQSIAVPWDRAAHPPGAPRNGWGYGQALPQRVLRLTRSSAHGVMRQTGAGGCRGCRGWHCRGGGQEGPHCCLSAAPASASRVLNGTALCRAERYGWAIEEKLERKIYNFPFKPVIHVINIDVI